MVSNPTLPAAFSPQRILVIKLRHHGDMLLVTPVISTLKRHYPSAQIDVLLYAETRDMLSANQDIHQLYCIDRQWKKQGVRHQLSQEWRLLRTLRAQRYDLVVNLADQWRSAIVTALSSAPVRIGFDFTKRRHPLWRASHTHLASTAEHGKQHTVEQNLSILAPLGLADDDSRVTMGYCEQDWQSASALIPTPWQAGYIVIQPTSRWFFKCWREARMSEVINALSQAGYPILLTSGPDARERAMIDAIMQGCPTAQVASLAGQLTLRQLAAIIDHARLFIGVDSVPMHMAAALQTPLVALFGPSKLVFWRPWQARGDVIWAGDFGALPDPDAIDTQTAERYLDLIPSNAVIAAAKRLLE
ncbi:MULTISPECIES: putative lipopolysaccharide heptosyltransferase III [Edwardsiella]|uniref:Lipopolysaccharide heptosyltransferase 3 n=2 Tax=Edwardsiella anguillarum TaxID=1821960 RepID=A0A076LNJ0_9GAMM|nr:MULTISPECIES: putative lipopolysaccharide heptosyltransferase III [Edwardsiella]AKM46348.1 glycosyl transferase family 9 [Edwardsiella sp. EA181011]GAJ67998.1 lipopolysaccharide heptosyltransferase III [Edwardsiella piscicida]AIJ08282.1 Lipopolysaccharide heptosyltransferase III [Edwardsiella anguillarum ET080813]AKR76391.1 putative lipopolysaccharide heptosyltransferase III [Edwardsiella sp. LADL05-105]KAB0591653.1 putative lipopolysaccharide heptosyltransferase III [Edwardsiella anguillar